MADPIAPQWVDVVNPQGKSVQIPADQVQAATSKGYSLADHVAPEAPSTYDVARSQGYGPGASLGIAALSPVASINEGALEGLTVGLGSGITKKIAGVVGPVIAKVAGAPDLTSEQAEKQYKYFAQGGAHSTLHAIGEAGGIAESAWIAPQLAGTRLASAGRAIGLINEAGEGVANATRALTSGLGTSVIGKAAQTGLEWGARGALETGIYTGVHELNEEMLGKPEMNAEKILGAAADGAAGGALFGGILGAGGSLAGSAYSGLKGLAANAIGESSGVLQRAANEQRWKSLDPLKKYSLEAERRVKGGTNAVGEVVGRYTGGGMKDAIASGDVASISAKLDEAVQNVGSRLGEVTGGSNAVIPYGAIDDALEKTIAPLRSKALHEGIVQSLEEARSSIASKLVPEAAVSEAAAAAGTGADAVAKMKAALRDAPVTIQSAIVQRKALDQIAYRESKALDPKLRVEFLRDMRSNFENAIVDAFDQAATKAGNPGAKAELLGLKHDYQALSIAQEAAETSAARVASNRNYSLTDYLAGGVASTIGAGIGDVVGGETGGVVGGLLGSMAGARINKFGRAKGNSLAASALESLAKYGSKAAEVAVPAEEAIAKNVGKPSTAAIAPQNPQQIALERKSAEHTQNAEMLSKVAEFASAQRAIRVVDEHISSAAKGLVSGPPSSASMPAARSYRVSAKTDKSSDVSLSKQFAEAMKQVQELQTKMPEIVTRTSSMMKSMPNTSQAAAMAAAKTLAYLQAQAPAPLTKPALGSPLPARYSSVQMSQYMQKFNVAKNPPAAMRAFARGKITVHQAQAFEAISPEVFASVQNAAIKDIADREASGSPIDFAARQRMHILLGIQTDPSQTLSMTKSLQENIAMYSSPKPSESSGAPGAPGSPASGPGANGLQFEQQSRLDKMEEH